MKNKFLLVAACISLLVLLFRDEFFMEQSRCGYSEEMLQSINLSRQWKRIVFAESAGKVSDTMQAKSSDLLTGNEDIIGSEYTEVTSTLGSLESKQLSNNVLFSALLVKLISESGADSNKTIGVIASGSFPALTIQTYSALQVLNRKAVVISSLGASSFGANNTNALWIDMEGWLNKKGQCRYQSELITYGAEGDTAGGIPEEGVAAFNAALRRNGKTVFVPVSVEQSMQKKLDLLLAKNIGLLINIGGNQSALGYCSHAELIPNGLQTGKNSCTHQQRGIISRISEKGIPYIHLLNLKNLAAQYGITDKNVTPAHSLFFKTRVNTWRVCGAILVISLLIFFHYRAKSKT